MGTRTKRGSLAVYCSADAISAAIAAMEAIIASDPDNPLAIQASKL